MMKIKRKIKYIGLDFDNTCVVEEWPGIGEELAGMRKVIKKLMSEGHKIILITQREHNLNGYDGDLLQEAINWLEERGIVLSGVNNNPFLDYNPPSRKIYSDVIIDDHSCGIGLVERTNSDGTRMKCVDWNYVDTWLVENEYYKRKVL